MYGIGFYDEYLSRMGNLKNKLDLATSYKIEYLKTLLKDNKVYKFISFKEHGEMKLKTLKEEKIWFSFYKTLNDEQKKEWDENFKLEQDPRITKVGHFLRKSSLDELPQILNILKGEMSIIGPRPIVQDELEKYKSNKDKLLSVLPGLTGYWAANGRSCTTYEDRMNMELYYVDNCSLLLDMKIFFKTIKIVIKKEGAR